MKWLLVNNVKVEQNTTYEVKVPTVLIDNRRMMKEYLRHDALLNRKITYNYEYLPPPYFTTEPPRMEEFTLNIVDNDDYNELTTVKVLPLVKPALTVIITDEDIKMTGSIDAAIYHKMLKALDIDFVIIDQDDAEPSNAMFIRKSHLESVLKYCLEQAVVSGIETLAYDEHENQAALSLEEQQSVLTEYIQKVIDMPERDLLIR